MALTGDRKTEYAEGLHVALPAAAGVVIYAGALVCLNADGYAAPAADAAGLVIAGVAMERGDNSSGADGAVTVTVRTRGLFRLKGSSLAQSQAGDAMYAVDDETIAASAANSVAVGKLLKIESAGDGWVLIG